MVKACEACGRSFDAQRSTARFCGSTCRSNVSTGRATVVVPGDVVPLPTSDGAAGSELIASVRERVGSAELDGSPEGLALIALAERMVSEPSGSAYASLQRQLMAGLDRVEALRPRASALDELRLRRDRKRRTA